MSPHIFQAAIEEVTDILPVGLVLDHFGDMFFGIVGHDVKDVKFAQVRVQKLETRLEVFSKIMEYFPLSER